ncbi:MAG: putative zinc-type alcohol dehydrogenase-like protein YjmD [Candidatus Lokiarchaeum sp. GC14_75]|nr:MAG: putative zinc-type alcohol dehydrogenase-like protein YjmD [Candidatus Lokiarchaeum sp. GC14_75]
MLQQIMTAPGKIEFQEISIPKLNENEVLVKIMRIGVCGSDIHVYRGEHPYTQYPITQGHEVSGRIEKIGSKVQGFKLNDKVTIQPQVVCGRCYQCTHGNYHICDDLKVMGFQTTGAASEFFAVNSEKLIKLPSEMTYEEGAMIEPCAVGVHAVLKGGDVSDFNVLVLGAGPIGNLISQTAKALGARSVMITDLSDYRLGIAEEVGIDFTINPLKQTLSEEIFKSFGPHKADLIIECVGVNETIETAIDIARKGTDIIVVGVFADNPSINLGYIQDRELRLIGNLMYQTKDYIKAIELIQSKKINLKPLMSTHFPFKDYIKAYEYIEKKKDKVLKVFIDVNQ